MKNNKLFLINPLVFVVSLVVFSSVMAATPPDGGALMREAEKLQPLETNVIPKMPDKVTLPEKIDGVSLPVERFILNGNSVIADDELQAIVLPWIGKKLTLVELNYLTDLIAERYRENGYLVRVFLPEQNVKDGSVLIEIIESRFGKVIIDSTTDRYSNDPDLFAGMLQNRQTPGELLNLSDVERASLLLNDLPGITAKTVLAASDKANHTDVKLSVSDSDRHVSSVSLDNYGSRSSGKYRLLYATKLASPFNRGDLLSGDAMVSEGNLYAKLGYDLPVGLDGLRLGASISLLSYSLVGDFEALDAKGSATNLTFSANYPLIRQVGHNLRLSGNYFLRGYTNKQLGVETSDKSVNAFNFGLSGDRLDDYYGGGVFYYGANITLGDLDLSGNQSNLTLDQLSARTNGSYTKLDWNVARLQRINKSTNLWLSANGQFVSKSMDSSETISLGGMAGIKAYPNLEVTGDEGLILTSELRHKLTSNWELKAFFDYGQVILKSTLSGTEKKYNLKGYGVGLNWSIPEESMTANLTVARRIGENPLKDPVTGDDSDGSKDIYPIWFNLTRRF